MKSASDDGSMGFCPTVTFPLRTRKLALQSSSPVAANRRPKSVVRMETENNQEGEGGTGSGSEQYGMKLRLREESEAPFRKVRMLIYSASAASAGIGGFVAGSRIVAALTGVSGVQPLSETVPNLAIDLGVIGAAFFLYSQDVKAGERRLQRLQRQDMVGSLPIEISNGKVIKVADLKSSRRVLLVTGDALSVKTVLDAGVKDMDKLRELELVVVPITFDTGKSFEDLAGEWSGQGIARPIQLDKWRLWAEEEAKKAKAPSMEKGCFMTIIRKDGKVGGRSNQPLMWEKLIADLEKLPKNDRFGVP